MTDIILDVQNLKKYFKTPRGQLHAVDDITFKLERGKTLGIVGESGCGKSTTGRCILRLIEPTSGKVIFDGEDILRLNSRQMRARRSDMQIIFQDPFSSLDPGNTVMQTIAEGVKMRGKYKTKAEVEHRVLELMKTVGLAERLINSYPHELGGGRRQRIGIARALAVEPKLIICDEPVSALDVSIQAQILNLLKELQYEYRSDNRTALMQMREQFQELLKIAEYFDAHFEAELLRERPCGGRVPEDAERELLDRCRVAVGEVTGAVPSLRSGSTDANIPLSFGIPAVTFGLYRGDGAHTRQESVEIDSLLPGMKIGLDLVVSSFLN